MSSQTSLFFLLRFIFLLKPFDHKAVPTEQRLTWKICFCENEIAKNELQAICCVYWNRCSSVIIANVKKKNVTLTFCIRFIVCMYVCVWVCVFVWTARKCVGNLIIHSFFFVGYIYFSQCNETGPTDEKLGWNCQVQQLFAILQVEWIEKFVWQFRLYLCQKDYHTIMITIATRNYSNVTWKRNPLLATRTKDANMGRQRKRKNHI